MQECGVLQARTPSFGETYVALDIAYTHRLLCFQDVQRHRTAECTGEPSAKRDTGARRVTVLVFPPFQLSPRVVQLDCQVQDGPGEEVHSIDWQSQLNGPFTSQPVGLHESLSRHPHPTRLYLAFSDCFAIDGSPLNRCAAQLTAGLSHVEWGGTLIGYRAREPASTLTQFFDVSMDDLPAFTKFLREYGAPRSPATDGTGLRFDIDDFESFLSSGVPFPQHPDGWAHPFAQQRAAESEVIYLSQQSRQRAAMRSMIREELAQESGKLRERVREEVRTQVWATLVSAALSLAIAYGVWRFILAPILHLFLATWRMVDSVLARTHSWLVERVIALLSSILGL